MTAASYLRAVVACAVTALFLCLYVYSYTTHDSSTTGTITVVRSHTIDQELQYSKGPEDDRDVSRRTSTPVQSRSSAEYAPSPPHHPSTPHSYTTHESSTTATKIDQKLQYSKGPEDDRDVSHRTSTAVQSHSSAEHTPSPPHHPSTPPSTTYTSVAHYPSTFPHSAPVAHHPSVPTSIASIMHHSSSPPNSALAVHHPSTPPSNAFVAHRSSTPLHSASVAHHPSTPTSTASVAHQSSSPQTMSQVHRDLTFTVAKDFTFPHPQVFKPVNVVLACRWVRELKQYLSSVDPTQPVTVTVASYDFAANLLNWLISAQVMTSPPLKSILVISFDNALHKMLVHRQIPSVCVPYISVLRNPKSLGVHKVWMTRLAVIRLINHWGFDVQQFDTDAIILRNPQPVFDLFSGFDVVGSRAKLPFELGKGQWGFTVCMGVILFRSTQRTGENGGCHYTLKNNQHSVNKWSLPCIADCCTNISSPSLPPSFPLPPLRSSRVTVEGHG